MKVSTRCHTMKKKIQEKSGELIKKGYLTMIKKIPMEDLRDMLAILLWDVKLAVAKAEMDEPLEVSKFSKEEQELYQNTFMKLSHFDKTRYEVLHKKLDEDFKIYEKKTVSSPFFEALPEFLKQDTLLGIKKTTQIFPKVPLLVETMREIINLRSTGKELPDDQKITEIEFFKSDTSDKDYKIVINQDYANPLKISRSIKAWDRLIELAENGNLEVNNENGDLYDYLNFNSSNKLYTKTKYPVQVIIGQEDNFFVPLFKISMYTEKALIQRQNKLKIST
jgi:hypothetical protein